MYIELPNVALAIVEFTNFELLNVESLNIERYRTWKRRTSKQEEIQTGSSPCPCSYASEAIIKNILHNTIHH
jgi:hypothetical protein